MSEELKNQPAVNTGAAEEVSEQVAVRMDKMHKLEERVSCLLVMPIR